MAHTVRFRTKRKPSASLERGRRFDKLELELDRYPHLRSLAGPIVTAFVLGATASLWSLLR